jgi:DNA polymerase-1
MTRHTVITDTFGLFYQNFFALPPMYSPQMEPTNAVYGLTKDLFTLLKEFRFDRFFCAFDLKGKTFRRELYPQYKAHRLETPAELLPQIPCIAGIIEAFQIPILKHEGYEADDVIATVAATASPDHIVTIVSPDKDCRQLLSEHVRIFNLRKRCFYDTESLRADWGVTPAQCVDFQSIVGDSSDNIPGVHGIGTKGAAELLQKYGTLDGIYANIADIKGKKREYLTTHRQEADISRKLVELRRDVPVEIPDASYVGYDQAKLTALFDRYGFDSLHGFLQPTPIANSPILNSPIPNVLIPKPTLPEFPVYSPQAAPQTYPF